MRPRSAAKNYYLMRKSPRGRGRRDAVDRTTTTRPTDRPPKRPRRRRRRARAAGVSGGYAYRDTISFAPAVHYFLRHCHCPSVHLAVSVGLGVCLSLRSFFQSFWQNTHTEHRATVNGVKQSHLSPQTRMYPNYTHHRPRRPDHLRSLASADLCRICERFSSCSFVERRRGCF